MKLTKKLLQTALAVSVGLGFAGSAQADAFASSILTISNFRLLHSDGTAFSNTDFGTLTGTNDAHATAALDGVFANGAQSFGILSGNNPDVAHQTVGNPNPARAENDFNPFPAPPPVPGTFGYADQRLQGSSINIVTPAGTLPAGATAQTRADASLQSNGVASGNSDVGTSTTFNFALRAGDTMRVDFDATPYTLAFVSPGSGATTNANARLSWSVNIVDLSTGSTVFAFQPSALNSLSNVSRTDGFAGTSLYNPGTSHFTDVSSFLNNTDTYQITIQHNTLANALVAVPEPGALAIFGIGLLGLTGVSRRRRNGKA